MIYCRAFAVVLVVVLGGLVAAFLARSRKVVEAEPKYAASQPTVAPAGVPINEVLALDEDDTDESAPGSALAGARPQIPSPLAALNASEDEARVLHDAEQEKIAECMQQRGFEYSVNAHTDVHDVMTPHFENGDAVTASRTGYGLAEAVERGDEPLVEDANEKRLAQMRPEQRSAWEIALYGTPQSAPDTPSLQSTATSTEPTRKSDACLFRATRELYGEEHAELDRAFNALFDNVQANAAQDPEYLQGIVRWRQCMLKLNHSYPSPGAAQDVLESEFREGRLSIEELRSKEVDVALADASCYIEAGLFDARLRIEREVVAEHSELVLAFRASRDEAVQRSQRLVRRVSKTIGGR